MNYEEFIRLIQTDYTCNFEFVIQGCQIMIEKEFDSIATIDYPFIKDFFSYAGAVNLIPVEYNEKINSIMNKMK